jgi:hypothetical protein
VLSDLLLFSTSEPQPCLSYTSLFFASAICSVCHVHSMHHSSSVHFSCCTLPPSTHLNRLSTTVPNLFFVLHSFSTLCIVHALCKCFCMLYTSCRVLYLIIIATLQILWQLSHVSTSLSVMLRFLSLSISQDSSSSLSQSSSFLLLQF